MQVVTAAIAKAEEWGSSREKCARVSLQSAVCVCTHLQLAVLPAPCCSAAVSSSVNVLQTSSCLCASSPWQWQHRDITGLSLPCCSDGLSNQDARREPCQRRLCSCCFVLGVCHQALPAPCTTRAHGAWSFCGQGAGSCVSCLLVRSWDGCCLRMSHGSTREGGFLVAACEKPWM